MAAGDLVPMVGKEFEATLESASPALLRAMIKEFAQRMGRLPQNEETADTCDTEVTIEAILLKTATDREVVISYTPPWAR